MVKSMKLMWLDRLLTLVRFVRLLRLMSLGGW